MSFSSQNKNKTFEFKMEAGTEDEEHGVVVELDMPPMNNGEYQELRVVLNDHLRNLLTTAVTFDTHEQLLWAGTQSVRGDKMWTGSMNGKTQK